MSEPPIRLLISDVDRTLLTHDHVLPQAIIRAVQKLQQAEVPVLLATARSPTGVRPIFEALGLSGATCCFNGAWIGDLAAMTAQFECRLDRVLGLEIATAARAAGASVIWYGLDRCHALAADAAVAQVETRITGDHLDLVPEVEALLDRPYKLMAVCPEAGIEALVEALLQRFGAEACITRSGPHLVEVVGLEARKDLAAARMARALGHAAEAVAAAGDSDNDVQMLSWAGLSFVPANAKDHIRKLADIVTPSCDEAGLALGLTWLADQRGQRGGDQPLPAPLTATTTTA